MIDAAEARAIGLVQAVFPAAELMAEALKLAGEIAAKPPLAVRYIKSQIHHALNVDIEAGHEIERDLFALTFASDDRREGMDAFLEKRKPTGFSRQVGVPRPAGRPRAHAVGRSSRPLGGGPPRAGGRAPRRPRGSPRPRRRPRP